MPAITQNHRHDQRGRFACCYVDARDRRHYNAINVVSAQGNSIFQVKDTSTGNDNFGGLAMTGAFVSRDSYWGEEYNVGSSQLAPRRRRGQCHQLF